MSTKINTEAKRKRETPTEGVEGGESGEASVGSVGSEPAYHQTEQEGGILHQRIMAGGEGGGKAPAAKRHKVSPKVEGSAKVEASPLPDMPEENLSTCPEDLCAMALAFEKGDTWKGLQDFEVYERLLRQMDPGSVSANRAGALGLLKDITGLSETQYTEKRDAAQCEAFMEKLKAFKESGAGYHAGLDEQFPLFSGPAPAHHPYPAAFRG